MEYANNVRLPYDVKNVIWKFLVMKSMNAQDVLVLFVSMTLTFGEWFVRMI